VVADARDLACGIMITFTCDLSPGTWIREAEGVTVCFDLGKGKTTLHA